ncbi:peroxisomal ATPase PEX6-like isoform X3 [Syngnathoides biaculeatus]|uniref:peroxisomal ATPase PEX6-like isoform X3 n=1 Tax=Syngnathoides biaculeatus TaxID=300417 RepID=UPI002ADD8539|nr:peroxisomal ATPase PEX6-like isoform X3 [Syngnathoides biaculeatus]
MAAAQADLLRLEAFPPHLSPLDVLVSRWQLSSLFPRDRSDPPTVLFIPRRTTARAPAVLFRVLAVSDQEAALFGGAAGGAPSPSSEPRVRLFASGLFLRLRGLPAAGSSGTVRPVAPVSLDEVVLGVRGDDADRLAAKLLELCRSECCVLARQGEPLVAELPGQTADALVLSCGPLAQGRITPDTAVVLADCAGRWPDAPKRAPPTRKLQLCASDFAHDAAGLGRGRSLLDGAGRRGSAVIPEEAERRLEVRVTDPERWLDGEARDREDADPDARLYVGRRALLRLGLFDGEWVKLRPAVRGARWRAAKLAARRSDRARDDDDGGGGCVSETLWFNLTRGEETPGATCCLTLKRWRRPPNGAGDSRTSCRSASPPPASELHLRPVASPLRGRPGRCDDLLAAHFSVPRLVAPGDVLRVPTRSHPDLLEDDPDRRRALLFRVERVRPADRTEGEADRCYLADAARASLFMGPPVNCPVPWSAADLRDGPSPPGLERTVDAISRILRPYRHGGSLPACRLLVHGPAGSGKVTAVVASGSGLHLQLVKVDCVGVCGDTPAATEARLTSLLERADALQPCVLLLRNLQFLLRSRGGADDDARVQAALCRVLCGAPSRVAVVATVRKLRQLPAGVAAVFIHQVALQSPTEEQRRVMVTGLSRDLRLGRDVDLERIAQVTAGFVLGDFRSLLAEASRAACRRLVRDCPGLREDDVVAGGATVSGRDFTAALRTLQDVRSEAVGAPSIPAVRWEDVGGLERAKKDILDTVQLPLQRPQLLALNLNRTGILLHGPPGTGKTLLAKAVATECSMTFLSVKGPELLNMYVGQSEENIREVFERARSAAPCVVFFDELDSLAPSRGRSGDSGGVMDRVVAQLLAELDALNASARVFVIGATNRPDLLDQSLLRPGRFDKLVYVGINRDPESQLQVLRAVLRNFRLDDGVDLPQVLARCPAHTSGADLYALCSDAMTAAVKRKIRAVEHVLRFRDLSGKWRPARRETLWSVFFILGLGTLLPWNFFMTATAYFTGRLRESTNGTEGEEPGGGGAPEAKFNNVMTLCAMLPLLVFTCLNSVLHSRIREAVRVSGSLTLILAVFLLTAALAKVRLEPTAFYCVTALSVVAVNCERVALPRLRLLPTGSRLTLVAAPAFGAILQGSLFGMAGAFPAGYTAPVMSGQGLAGTFAALAMICSVASTAPPPSFPLFSPSVALLSILAFRPPSFRPRCPRPRPLARSRPFLPLAGGSDVDESSFGYFISACVVILLSILSYAVLPKLEFFRFYHQRKDGRDHDVNVSLDRPGPAGRAGVSVTAVFKKIWVAAACVWGTFTVTIGTFPAIAADTKSTLPRGSAWETYSVPVSCFLLFNASDWAGRSLSAFCTWPGKDSALLPVLVACRAALVPALMLCNVQPRRHLPVVFRHDAFFAAFMLVFAFTNGYLASLAMCFGPKKVPPHEAETAGSVMAFFLSLGLASGAALSFVLRALV